MTVAAIKKAIRKLPSRRRTELATWLAACDQKLWDRELEKDFSPGGRGMKLLDQVDTWIERGNFKPMR